MARTWSSYGKRHTTRQRPVIAKQDGLQIFGHHLQNDQVFATDAPNNTRGPSADNKMTRSQSAQALQMEGPNFRSTTYTTERPRSAQQQYQINTALSQPKWKEIPFHQYVISSDRRDVPKRRLQPTQRLFNYN